MLQGFILIVFLIGAVYGVNKLSGSLEAKITDGRTQIWLVVGAVVFFVMLGLWAY